jgi:hypothetical protein
MSVYLRIRNSNPARRRLDHRTPVSGGAPIRWLFRWLLVAGAIVLIAVLFGRWAWAD